MIEFDELWEWVVESLGYYVVSWIFVVFNCGFLVVGYKFVVLSLTMVRLGLFYS